MHMAGAWKELDETLRAQVVEAIDAYREVRPSLDDVTEHLRQEVASLLEASDVKPLFVTARTKSVESFRQKASRTVLPAESESGRELEFSAPLEQLHDLVGIRVIVMLPNDVREAAAVIKRRRGPFYCESDREKDIGSLESGTYGYSSRHLILKPRVDEVVEAFQAPRGRSVSDFLFEVQIRTILAHAWSEIEHDIRFKRRDARAWSPHLDRQFTASAAMLESVEGVFVDIDERHQAISAYWDPQGAGAEPLTAERVGEVWRTLWPHLERRSGGDWDWATTLLDAHGLGTTRELVELLDAETIRQIRAALDHRYSPGPDRLLDDLLLARYGGAHIQKTAGADPQRRASLGRRLQQLRTYGREIGSVALGGGAAKRH